MGLLAKSRSHRGPHAWMGNVQDEGGGGLRDPTWRAVLRSGPLRGRSRARGGCGEGTRKLDLFVSAERTGEPSRERKDSLGARRAALTHREGCL